MENDRLLSPRKNDLLSEADEMVQQEKRDGATKGRRKKRWIIVSKPQGTPPRSSYRSRRREEIENRSRDGRREPPMGYRPDRQKNEPAWFAHLQESWSDASSESSADDDQDDYLFDDPEALAEDVINSVGLKSVGLNKIFCLPTADSDTEAQDEDDELDGANEITMQPSKDSTADGKVVSYRRAPNRGFASRFQKEFNARLEEFDLCAPLTCGRATKEPNLEEVRKNQIPLLSPASSMSEENFDTQTEVELFREDVQLGIKDPPKRRTRGSGGARNEDDRSLQLEISSVNVEPSFPMKDNLEHTPKEDKEILSDDKSEEDVTTGSSTGINDDKNKPKGHTLNIDSVDDAEFNMAKSPPNDAEKVNDQDDSGLEGSSNSGRSVQETNAEHESVAESAVDSKVDGDMSEAMSNFEIQSILTDLNTSAEPNKNGENKSASESADNNRNDDRESNEIGNNDVDMILGDFTISEGNSNDCDDESPGEVVSNNPEESSKALGPKPSQDSSNTENISTAVDGQPPIGIDSSRSDENISAGDEKLPVDSYSSEEICKTGDKILPIDTDLNKSEVCKAGDEIPTNGTDLNNFEEDGKSNENPSLNETKNSEDDKDPQVPSKLGNSEKVETLCCESKDFNLSLEDGVHCLLKVISEVVDPAKQTDVASNETTQESARKDNCDTTALKELTLICQDKLHVSGDKIPHEKQSSHPTRPLITNHKQIASFRRKFMSHTKKQAVTVESADMNAIFPRKNAKRRTSPKTVTSNVEGTGSSPQKETRSETETAQDKGPTSQKKKPVVVHHKPSSSFRQKFLKKKTTPKTMKLNVDGKETNNLPTDDETVPTQGSDSYKSSSGSSKERIGHSETEASEEGKVSGDSVIVKKDFLPDTISTPIFEEEAVNGKSNDDVNLSCLTTSILVDDEEDEARDSEGDVETEQQIDFQPIMITSGESNNYCADSDFAATIVTDNSKADEAKSDRSTLTQQSSPEFINSSDQKDVVDMTPSSSQNDEACSLNKIPARAAFYTSIRSEASKVHDDAALARQVSSQYRKNYRQRFLNKRVYQNQQTQSSELEQKQ